MGRSGVCDDTTAPHGKPWAVGWTGSADGQPCTRRAEAVWAARVAAKVLTSPTDRVEGRACDQIGERVAHRAGLSPRDGSDSRFSPCLHGACSSVRPTLLEATGHDGAQG